MDKPLPVLEKCREVYCKPCPCGAGDVMVDVCRPEQPHPKTKRYQGRFSCEACEKKYQVMEQDTDVLIVEQGEVKKRGKLRTQWHEECELLMASSKVIHLLGQFKEILERFTNRQRLAEYLRHVGLIFQTDQEFEEDYEDPKSWIKHEIRVSHLPRIMEILQTEDSELMEKVASLEDLWRQSRAPYEPVGRVLFKKDPY